MLNYSKTHRISLINQDLGSLSVRSQALSQLSQSVKPIFHQNEKYQASGTFASPNARNSTSASPNARIPTCWYLLR